MREVGEMRDRWCILRTSAGRTVPLSKSLTADGIDVWTPVQVEMKRAGRKRERVERPAPIMPTFVFARASGLPDIARVLASPMSPHPPFSLFRWDGRVPLLADCDIAALRDAEERARKAVLKKTHRHIFPVGQQVRVAEGAGAGMAGVVEAGDGTFALVAFGGTFRMKIATFLLRTDEVHGNQIAA